MRISLGRPFRLNFYGWYVAHYYLPPIIHACCDLSPALDVWELGTPWRIFRWNLD